MIINRLSNYFKSFLNTFSDGKIIGMVLNAEIVSQIEQKNQTQAQPLNWRYVFDIETNTSTLYLGYDPWVQSLKQLL